MIRDVLGVVIRLPGLGFLIIDDEIEDYAEEMADDFDKNNKKKVIEELLKIWNQTIEQFKKYMTVS